MNRRASMYGMVSLAVILFSIVFMYQISGENQRALMKSYKIAFSFSHGCGGIAPIPRIYSRYYFTADSLHNDSTVQALEQRLGTLGKSFDSLHGVDVTFADSTAFEYYLKTLAICHEYPHKQIIPFEHHIYAHSMSRYQLWEDSIITQQNKRFQDMELDMSYP